MDISSTPTAAASSSVSIAPTLAMALASIDGWTDLPAARRAFLKATMVRLGEMLGDPPPMIMLVPDYVRMRLLTPPPSAFGLGEGTMRNYRSAVRFVMERLGVIDACDAPLSPAWQALLGPLESHAKAPLAKLADYCALNGIEPDEVDDLTFAAFIQWLEARTIVARPKRLAGSCRRAWNRFSATIPGWPSTQLRAPSDAHQFILSLDTFTPAFQEDLTRYGTKLGARGKPFHEERKAAQIWSDGTSPTPSRHAERGPGLRPISVAVRLGHLRWAASALVASGHVPITAINMVTDLVVPLERAHSAMEYLFNLRGQTPWAGAMHVFEVLMMLAKHEARLLEDQLEELRGWRRDVVPEAKGMSPRRRERIIAAMEPARLQSLLRLPSTCMAQALELLPSQPRDATSLAMRALAVQMFLTTQLRLGNMISLRVDQHLQSHDPAQRRYQRIEIPAHEMKNRNPTSRPVGATTQVMIDQWLRHFRPTLTSDPGGYLFPGHGMPHICRQAMRDAVKGITRLVVGVPLTPHDFRGLAGKIHLSMHPGDYGTVKHMLGHTSIDTTIDSYTADETDEAAANFDTLVLNLKTGKTRLGEPPTTKRSIRKQLALPTKPGGKPQGSRGRR